jgi:hypothetical protein
MLEDERLATLKLRGFWEGEAGFESADGSWLIRREGTFTRRLSVLDPASGAEIARFQGRWFGRGTLTLAGGDELEWRPLNLWWGDWAFARENGEPVMRFRRRLALLRDRWAVTFEDASLPPRHLATLAAVGCFVLAKMRRRGAH